VKNEPVVSADLTGLQSVQMGTQWLNKLQISADWTPFSVKNQKLGIDGQINIALNAKGQIPDFPAFSNAFAMSYQGKNAGNVDFIQFMSTSTTVGKTNNPGFFDTAPLVMPLFEFKTIQSNPFSQILTGLLGRDIGINWSVDTLNQPYFLPSLGLLPTILPADPRYVEPFGLKAAGQRKGNSILMLDEPDMIFYAASKLEKFANRDKSVNKVIVTALFDTYAVAKGKPFFHLGRFCRSNGKSTWKEL
jgi:hypothetical protein